MKESDSIIHAKAPPPGTLGKAELYAISLGYTIGAGIVSLIGPALAQTGHSAWLAYLLAIFFGLLTNLPAIFITSTLRLGGGPYSMLAGLGGKNIAGIYAIAFFAQTINMGVFGLAFGMYANSLWSWMNTYVVGIISITFFFVVNLFGVDFMAKVQKLMTWILIAAFLAFAVIGLFNINQPIFTFSASGFLKNGSSGFIATVFLYVASTNSYLMTMSYGKNAKDAQRDIPWSMLMCVPTFIVLYCGVTIAGSGTLPLEEVAGKTLTVTARHLFPGGFFVAFMICGPVQAITSTMNSAFANNCVPIAQSCKDGWLPTGLAKQNRFGAYYRILLILYLIGIVPLLAGIDLTTAIMIINLVLSCMSFLYTFAYWRMPKKYPISWKQSKFHVPDQVYYALVIIAFLGWMAIFINSLRTINTVTIAIMIVLSAFAIVYGMIRSKDPNIKIEISMWALNEADERG